MWETEKKAVLEAAKSMCDKGLVVGTSGNVSMRLPISDGRELLAISPTSLPYDMMKMEDIVVVDFDGERVEGELTHSIETMLHLAIYKARKKINAVIHTHPVFGGVVSVLGHDIPAILDDQVTYLGGEIKLAPYALPGSLELANNVVTALGPKNAVVLANHGALAIGRDMREAFTHCEMLEKTAKIYVHALSAGEIVPLPKEAYDLEHAYFVIHFGEEN
jgi:L-fuculose-phosphate aldolase